MHGEGISAFGMEIVDKKVMKTESEEPLPELISGSEEQIEDRLSVWREILVKDYEKEIKIDGYIGPEMNFVLKDKDNNKIHITEKFSYTDSSGYQLDIFSGGKNVGFLRYQAGADSTPISMGKTFINPEFRKLGLNTLLFQHMTRLHPGAETVWSKMDDDNWLEYDRAIKNGKNSVEAINNTPAGKVRIRAGWELDLKESVLPNLEEDGDYISAKVRPIYKKKSSV